MRRIKISDLIKSLEKGVRPAGLGYGDYSAAMRKAGKDPMSKAEYEEKEEEDDDDDDEEEEEEEEEEAEKSLKVDGAALRKSINTYDTVEGGIQTQGGSREAYLRARLDNGTITKSERNEFGHLLMGEDDSRGTPMRKSLSERIEDDNPDSARLVRANDFLKSLTASIDDSLESVHEAISQESAQTRDLVKAQGDMVRMLAGYSMSLGEIVEEQTEIIKSLRGRVDDVERQPASRRAHQTPKGPDRKRPLNKSVIGDDSADDGLKREQILHGFRILVKSAAEDGDNKLAKSLTEQSAVFESTSRIHKTTYQSIENALR